MFQRSTGFLITAVIIVLLGLMPPWISISPGWITIGGVDFSPLWMPPHVTAQVDTVVFLSEWIAVGVAGSLISLIFGR